MFTLDMNARPASRAAKQYLSFKVLKLLARRKRPQPVPHDYAEIERFKLDLDEARAYVDARPAEGDVGIISIQN